jgi:hypothetical protein
MLLEAYYRRTSFFPQDALVEPLSRAVPGVSADWLGNHKEDQ